MARCNVGWMTNSASDQFAVKPQIADPRPQPRPAIPPRSAARTTSTCPCRPGQGYVAFVTDAYARIPLAFPRWPPWSLTIEQATFANKKAYST